MIWFGSFFLSGGSGLKTDYEKEWIKVDSLEKIGLYKKALDHSRFIYSNAAKEHDSGNELKGLIFQLRYLHLLADDGFPRLIEEMEKEVNDERVVIRAIKENMLAELYHLYYQNNRWNIQNNTGFADDSNFRFWTSEQFGFYIDSLFQSSLEQKNILSSEGLEEFKVILKDSLVMDHEYSVFDLLSFRALEFYGNTDLDFSPDPLPALLLDPVLFTSKDKFLASGNNKGGNSFFNRSLKIYSDLLKEEGGFSDKFVETDLKRLEYVSQIYLGDKKDSLYLGALDRLFSDHAAPGARAKISLKKAEYFLLRSGNYQINSDNSIKYESDRLDAVKWAEKVIDLSPVSREAKEAQNLINGVKKADLIVSTESVSPGLMKIPVSFEYRNIDSIFCWVLPAEPEEALRRYNRSPKKEYHNEIKGALKRYFFEIPDRGDFNQHRVNLVLDPLAPGTYRLLCSDNENPDFESSLLSEGIIRVSDIAWITKTVKNGELEVYTLDRTTGKPLGGVLVTQYYSRYDNRSREENLERGGSFLSDNSGRVLIGSNQGVPGQFNRNSFFLKFGEGAESVFGSGSYYLQTNFNQQKPRPVMKIFSDRGIYRPGQEIQFSGLLVTKGEKNLNVEKGVDVEILLRDPRHKVIDTIYSKTDEAGFIEGRFFLSDDALGGRYQISTGYGSQFIQVEEYRRPGFKIELDRDNNVYLPGDSIIISGRAEAFAGTALGGADAEIQTYIGVSRPGFYRQSFFGRRIFLGKKNDRLDNDGRFRFYIRSLDIPESANITNSYEFIVKVKDTNGETREISHRVQIGPSSHRAKISGPSIVNRKKEKTWKIELLSPENRPVRSDIQVEIGLLTDQFKGYIPFPLPSPDTWMISKKEWEKYFPQWHYNPAGVKDSILRVFFQQEIIAGEDAVSLAPDFSKWPIGRYRIIVRAAGRENAIIGSSDFDIFDKGKKVLPVVNDVWLSGNREVYKPGQNIKVYAGSGFSGKYLFEVAGLDSVYQKEWISLSGKKIEVEFPVTEDMRGNLMVQVSGYIKNHFISKSLILAIPWSNKELTVRGLDEISEFEPGEEVMLPFTVVDASSNPVKLKGVISIYDSSLDELQDFKWSKFSWPVITRAIPWQPGSYSSNRHILVRVPVTDYTDPGFLPQLGIDWFGLGYYGAGNIYATKTAMRPAAERVEAAGTEGEDAEVFMIREDEAVNDSFNETQLAEEESKGQPPFFRTDFRETAYFNAAISTDEAGAGHLKFIVPEALTKWNIKLFGHDGALAQAILDSRFQSTKKLMILPNIPRFVREGDVLSMTVKIDYSGGESEGGELSFTAINPIDGEIVDIHNDGLKFTEVTWLEKNWQFEVPEGIEELELMFSARIGMHSDGMKTSIPVLPKRLSFWSSDNFYLLGANSKYDYQGSGMDKLVLEMNTNPVWYALQSLPVYSHNEIECSEYWFNRFFTAGMIRKISESNPEISVDIKRLADEAGDNQNLNPFLRNEEIRKYDLETGIWQGSGREELLRIQLLANSFDKDQNRIELGKSLEKLIGLQLSDGSWPWFRGMRPDFRMTLHILGGLAEIRLLDSGLASDRDFINMTVRAVGFIDGVMYNRYNNFNLNNKDDDPPLSGDLITYLYVRSFFPEIGMSEKNEEAWKHYMDLSAKTWLQWSVSQQSFIGLAHHRNGNDILSGRILRSFVDRLLEADNGGSYLKNTTAYSRWNDRDIWQQSRLIEFFHEIPGGRKYIDELKSWLILQKRGRSWGDRISGSLAVKSLLFYGSEWLKETSEIVVESGNEYFSPLRIKLGTDPGGFYRYEWKKEDLGEEFNISITKVSESPAWGSVMDLRTEMLDSLIQTGDDLSIKRRVLVEVIESGRARWVPATGQKLFPGQKIKISLEVAAAEQVDYVQLRDYRPAAFEPLKSLSGNRWGRGVSWYQESGDLYTDLYIHRLPKGISLFEYDLFVEQAGEFSLGYSEIQSQYAPEFMARSSGGRIKVGSN